MAHYSWTFRDFMSLQQLTLEKTVRVFFCRPVIRMPRIYFKNIKMHI